MADLADGDVKMDTGDDIPVDGGDDIAIHQLLKDVVDEPEIPEAGDDNGNDNQMAGSEDEEEIKEKRAPRVRKFRTIDAHLWGMSEVEREALYAAIQLEDPVQPAVPVPVVDVAENGESEDASYSKEAVVLSGATEEQIQAARRILRTSWRMAAISQFHATFPQLGLRGFDIERLEADLDGSSTVDEPGMYAGHVIGRLLFTLTKDSRMAGDPRDVAWVKKLRREYLKRDPAHNTLGDEPPEFDDDSRSRGASHTPFDHNSALTSAEPPIRDFKPAAALATSITGYSEATETLSVQLDLATPVVEITKAEDMLHPVKIEPDLANALPLTYSSKGWEDLTVEERVHGIWSCCEWHFLNAEKFRNYLSKYRIDDDHSLWRIEPLGRDAEGGVYWLFDDNRLWLERETPRKHKLRLISEEVAKLRAAQDRAHNKAMRIQKRDKLRAFYQKKREDREAAYEKERAQRAIKEKEDARARAEMAKLDAEIIEEDEHFSQTGKGRGKRKRASSDSEAEPAPEEPRTSARLTDTRSFERSGRRGKALLAATRRSTRNPGPMIASGMPGDEDWQQIPAEWLKSEDQEKDEDPDFGALQTNGHISESDHEMSLDESESDVPTNKPKRRGPGRPRKDANEIISRRSSRKSRPVPRSRIQADDEDEELATVSAHKQDGLESDLSDLSDLEEDDDDADDNDSDEERILGDANRKGYYPDSMYELGPTFDDENQEDLRGDFVRWEAICTNLDEWLVFEERFAGTDNVDETQLLNSVTDRILPAVQAAYERKVEEKQKRITAERKAAAKAKQEVIAEQHRIAKEEARQASIDNSMFATRSSGRHRSSRIAQKEATLDNVRKQRNRNEPLHYNGIAAMEQLDPEEQRAQEMDRRALRAKQREEEKRQKEEAALMAALAASEEQDQSEHEENEVNEHDDAEYMPPDQVDIAVGSTDAYEPQTNGADDSANQVQAWGDANDDYFLDCSVCRKRGMNLDYHAQLVQCDGCDRWEHVVCHRKADAAAGLPKRDFANEDFLCEDCEELGASVKIVPAAPKRERSEKQLAGAMKGAAKRKARMERLKKDVEKSNSGYGNSPPTRKTVKRKKATKSRRDDGTADDFVNDATINDSFTPQDEIFARPVQDGLSIELQNESDASGQTGYSLYPAPEVQDSLPQQA